MPISKASNSSAATSSPSTSSTCSSRRARSRTRRPTQHRARGIEVHGWGIDDEDTLNLLARPLHRPGAARLTDADRREHGVQTHAGVLGAVSGAAHTTSVSSHPRPHTTWPRPSTGPPRTSAGSACSSRRTPAASRPNCTSSRTTASNTAATSGTSCVCTDSRAPDGTANRSRSISCERFGTALPCLGGEPSTDDYSAMVAIIPGQWLAEIYEDHGARLLELNVRAFLQASGKVNRGIRDTLRNEPERFLAYNNGISATAGLGHAGPDAGRRTGNRLDPRPADRQRRADDGVGPPRDASAGSTSRESRCRRS